LRPKGRRRRHCIDFTACQAFVAWSRSVSTLADKEVEFGHANEIDKWEQPGSASGNAKEADPLKLFLDRFKNRPHHKIILESTPTVKGKSRIETGRLSSTNCYYHVPCPHCNKYQRLLMDNLKWEHLDNGRSDRDLARRTAKYHCQHCNAEISDNERILMVRMGVWCPEGCEIKHDVAMEVAIANMQPDSPHKWDGWATAPWITGTPLRNGPDAGYSLSSLYATSLSWGDIAAEFVVSKSKPQDLRNFINSWLAETWEAVQRKTTWEQLGERIVDRDIQREVVPEWASIITCGIDRQDDRFPWVVDAWGPNYQCATISYGEAYSFDEIMEKVVNRTWQHADGGPQLRMAFGLFDSGFRPDGVYEFCKKCYEKKFNIWPSKGSSTQLESEFRQSTLSNNTSMPGMVLFHVDTIRTQLWIEQQLSSGSYNLYSASIMEHQDYLEQVLNDAAVSELDSNNNSRERWERVNTNIPNDYRDCRRYSYVAMLIALRGQPPKPRVKHEAEPVKKQNVYFIQNERGF